MKTLLLAFLLILAGCDSDEDSVAEMNENIKNKCSELATKLNTGYDLEFKENATLCQIKGRVEGYLSNVGEIKEVEGALTVLKIQGRLKTDVEQEKCYKECKVQVVKEHPDWEKHEQGGHCFFTCSDKLGREY